ncbi:MAG TPA: hypothetical protein VK152_00435, partial [Paludibacter sp.]|nr:hypothetical protein [Paludibacter sp.]
MEKEFKFFHSWKRDVKCQSCYSREYKEKHPEKVKMFQKNWKKNNLEKVLSSNKKSYQLHRKKRIAGSLDYQKRNIEKIRQNKVSWREKNKEKMSAYEKEYYLKNRDEILRKKAETNRNRRNRVILAKDDYKKIEQIKKSSASWKERNKDKVYTCNKEYYLKNREY